MYSENIKLLTEPTIFKFEMVSSVTDDELQIYLKV